MKTIRLEDMNWPDIKDAMNKGYKTAVVAVGSNEQHGPHLPTKTDSLIGDMLAFRVAQELGNALVIPTISVGCSEHHLAFPGTISLKSETLKAVIEDYIYSLEKSGFETVLLLPSHGGNFATVKETVEELKSQFSHLNLYDFTDLFKFLDSQMKVSAEFGISQEEAGAHAGEIETSMILALSENLVDRERFASGYLGPLGEEQFKTILEKGMPALTENGILGDPSRATAERGMIYLEKSVEFILEELKKKKA